MVTIYSNTDAIVQNNSMRLRPIASKHTSNFGLVVVFARLDGDNSIYDYVMGKDVRWDDASKSSCSWGWGCYGTIKSKDGFIRQLASM